MLWINYPMVVRHFLNQISRLRESTSNKTPKDNREPRPTDGEEVSTTGNEGLTPAGETGLDEGTTGLDGQRRNCTASRSSATSPNLEVCLALDAHWQRNCRDQEPGEQKHLGCHDNAMEPEKARKKDTGLADVRHHTRL